MSNIDLSDQELDEIIEIIKNADLIPENKFTALLLKLMEVLYSESNVLHLQSPITICGDIHGQLFDVFQLFKKACPGNSIGNQQFLFMGDYVDRGRFSVDTFAFLCALKIKYPGQFHLLRGNHECRQINQMYGFYQEILFNYGHTGVWSLCNEVFDLLPMAAVIDRRVFSVHGGLSPTIKLIESINLINRQQELPSVGSFADLTWSDPEDVSSWKRNMRGAGYIFGKGPVHNFCYNNGLDFITRSHQPAMEGLQWFFDKKFVTVWSAPNYMYRTGNKATVMKYHPGHGNDITDEDRKNPDFIFDGNDDYHFVLFQPCPDNERKMPDEDIQSIYFL